MALHLIVAVSENNIIGNGLEIPWKAKGEQKLFKEITMGHTLILGRKTYESIGRPLPGRRMLVITRQEGYSAEGCVVANTIEEAFSLGVAMDCDAELFIAGGAEIYKQALPLVEEMHLTRIHTEVEGDILFPTIDFSQYICKEEKSFESNINYTYYHYVKK